MKENSRIQHEANIQSFKRKLAELEEMVVKVLEDSWNISWLAILVDSHIRYLQMIRLF